MNDWYYDSLPSVGRRIEVVWRVGSSGYERDESSVGTIELTASGTRGFQPDGSTRKYKSVGVTSNGSVERWRFLDGTSNDINVPVTQEGAMFTITTVKAKDGARGQVIDNATGNVLWESDVLTDDPDLSVEGAKTGPTKADEAARAKRDAVVAGLFN